MEVNTFQIRETLFEALHSTTHSGNNVKELHLDLGPNHFSPAGPFTPDTHWLPCEDLRGVSVWFQEMLKESVDAAAPPADPGSFPHAESLQLELVHLHGNGAFSSSIPSSNFTASHSLGDLQVALLLSSVWTLRLVEMRTVSTF